MAITTIILFVTAIVATIISCIAKKKQKEELLTLSSNLHQNFIRLFSEIEEKLENQSSRQLIKYEDAIEEVTPVTSPDLVIDLITREIRDHAIADISIKHRHNEASIYLVSPYERRKYIIKEGRYAVSTYEDELELGFEENSPKKLLI